MSRLGRYRGSETAFDIFDDEKENKTFKQLDNLENMLPSISISTTRHPSTHASVQALQSRIKDPITKHNTVGTVWPRNSGILNSGSFVNTTITSALNNPLDELLARLTEQQSTRNATTSPTDDSLSSTTDPFIEPSPMNLTADHTDTIEVLRLKKELEVAKERMAEMDFQLSHERNERLALAEMDFNQAQIARQTVEAVIGSPCPAQHPVLATSEPSSRMTDLEIVQSPGQWECNSPLTPFSVDQDMRDSEIRDSSFTPYRSQRSSPFQIDSYSNKYLPTEPFNINNVGMGPFSQLDPIAIWRSQSHLNHKPSALVPAYPGIVPWTPAAQLPANTMNNVEPLNYRRLLDRNMSCDWKYIVDKIVCNNDQQASIFLQQKLKQGTAEQKYSIVQAIINQAYPLMVNRFGNFLVQRCFEHGAPDQVIAIAQAIRGHTLNLSMDAFGCHVVQKAFDCVPEEYKAMMVHELLRRIPETVIHRYACHVWQKLFELRWNDTPPQIMKYVNEALRGMWHEVALGETGSLVVQNIFENCLEDDKRPCISEVLDSIDAVAHGQFGNWCIQHICEHGSVPDQARAIDHVIRYAAEYSTDQFASKVVEKCLKVGGVDFLDRYLDRVCEARDDRPRMPLIDVAGDQFGNYLIQHILTNADAQRREVVANHIRKHMVSLRGSKYGSRVAMLCCNPAYATRPGPPNGLSSTRYNGRYADPVLEGTQGRLFTGGGQFSRVARGGTGGTFR